MARHAAEMSDYKKAPTGAIAVYKGKVISVGWNQRKTSPIQEKYNRYRNFDNQVYVSPALHAEIACLSPIRDLDIDWGKVELYVYRKCRSTEFGLAKPCPACEAMIRSLNIRKIYYTGSQSFIFEQIA